MSKNAALNIICFAATVGKNTALGASLGCPWRSIGVPKHVLGRSWVMVGSPYVNMKNVVDP